MARCEDYPCCGHEPGCCPEYYKNGKQKYMVCVCGARVSVKSKYSICKSCMKGDRGEDRYYPFMQDY